MSDRLLPPDVDMGLGCMGMSQWYGEADPAEAAATILESLDAGVRYLDTAEVYGPYTNEELIGRAVKGRRSDAFIATKFGFPMIRPDGSQIPPDSSPENIRRAVDSSLRRLDTDYIDLLYQHRVDGRTPVEEVVGAMAELVQTGKVLHVGLCEVGVDTIRRAHAVHPLTAVQAEYSVWERNLEDGVLQAADELGIAVVAFCPLGRGYLSGRAPRPEDLAGDDFRRMDPRFTDGNFDRNRAFVEHLVSWARRLECTPAQLALAWVLARPWDIVPIPGTKRRRYLRENIGSRSLRLPTDQLALLDRELDDLRVAGDRYGESMKRYIDR